VTPEIPHFFIIPSLPLRIGRAVRFRRMRMRPDPGRRTRRQREYNLKKPIIPHEH
jgi:hypothetical protein